MLPWVPSLSAIYDIENINHRVGALSSMIYSFTVKIKVRFTLIDCKTCNTKIWLNNSGWDTNSREMSDCYC